jgi:isoquinoline 1-oxidoreductase beta subunit
MLVAAAAERWSVSAASITTNNGELFGPAGQQIAYGDIADEAMNGEVPGTVRLKSHQDFKFIGKPVGRLDAADKSTGRQLFGMDVKRPGMRTVLIARPPHFGGTITSFDARAAQAVNGVVAVLRVPLDRDAEGLAVIAEGYWPAKMGRDALVVEWKAPASLPDTQQMTAEFTALLGKPGAPARRARNPASGSPLRIIKADYQFPFLAHSPMEPLNAVIETQGRGKAMQVAVWTGTQFQTIDQATVAGVFGITPHQVSIHTQFAGGGFGRRATPTADYLADTAKVMKAWLATGESAPLKLVWSREDDVRGGYYRPFAMHRAEITLSHSGDVLSWKHRIVSPSILAGTAFEGSMVKQGVDATAVEGIADSAYPLPISVDVHHPKLSVPVLWWRSVGHSHTAFVMETLIDEVANASGKDPVAYRRTLLKQHPRHLAALELAVTRSGYGEKPLASGHAHGVAVHESFGSVVAYVVEVSMDNGRPKVHHVTGAIHCNTAVNPTAVEAQVQGAAIMGIGMTLEGAEITLKHGEVQQRNFDTYKVARMPDIPPIDVHIVPSTDAPTGVGEPGLPPIAPAIANAVRALTGKSLRALPYRSV